MKYSFLILFLLLFSNVQSQPIKNIKNPVEFFVHEYKDTTVYNDANDRCLIKDEFDINCDSLNDILLTDPYTGGAHNYDWSVFLKNQNGTYTYIGSMFFEGPGIVAKRISKGVSKVIAYEHVGFDEGNLNEYKVSFKGIKYIKKWSTKSDPSFDFETFFSTKIAESFCRIQTLIENINANWSELCQ
jgi:hypothetical protein